MTHSKILLAQTVVSLCKAHNIKHVIISPGSRNAPLTIEFTHNNFFNCYSIVDERCAAFFALGIAQQTQMPVVLVCTSGSALLNYYPAIAEAFYSTIPIVVVSADRPKHLIDVGDGQTIKQKEVYANHVLYSANLKLDLKDEDTKSQKEELPIFKNIENKLERFIGLQNDIQNFNETEVHKALTIAHLQSGPVHINCPFEEPLYQSDEMPDINIKSLRLESKQEHIDKDQLNDCLDVWQKSKKKLILVGVLQPNAIEEKWLDALAKDNSVIVFTETTSNLHHSDIFSEIDKVIAPLNTEEFKALQPDLLITFGGLVISKKMKTFLRKFQPQQHWHIGLHCANDTFFCLNKHIELSPNTFLSTILPQAIVQAKSSYKPYWLKIREYRREQHQHYLETIPFSDFSVFDTILKTLPNQSKLQVGNSSAIRYTQLFQLHKTVKVFCNRGTSGIDGSTSTAIGAAITSKEPTICVTGDLSFFYDSNALWNNYIPNNFRIIVVNNSGGGIFRILPGHKNTKTFDIFFETKHQLTAKQLSVMFGFEYQSAQNQKELNSALKSFYDDASQPKLLEIFTPSKENDKILLEYFEFIK